MDLPVARNLRPIRAEDECGVEQFLATIFDNRTTMHGNAVPACQAAQHFISGTAFAPRCGQHFGGGHAGISATAQIGPGFRQADQPGAVPGNRGFDQRFGLREVRGLVAALVHLDHADAHPLAPNHVTAPSSRGGGLPARGRVFRRGVGANRAWVRRGVRAKGAGYRPRAVAQAGSCVGRFQFPAGG